MIPGPMLFTLHLGYPVLPREPMLGMPLSTFPPPRPPQLAVRFLQNDDQRGPPPLDHSQTWGILLFCGSRVGSSFVSNKLPEEGLASELQEDGLSWLSMFKKPKRNGVGKHATWGGW